MAKKIKEIVIFLYLILIIISGYIIYRDFGVNGVNTKILTNKFILGVLVIILFSLMLLLIKKIIFGNKKQMEIHHRDKLFNSLVKNSDTIYAMYDTNKREYIYITNNVKEVLGIGVNNNEVEISKYIDEIFTIPVLKNELEEWNKKSEFASQMISYHNSEYQHTRWLRVKIYPFKEKKLRYNVIIISDVTKEHDQQHLLVTQASDIKTREKQLNQITSISYDVEIEINISTKEFTLHNLKSDLKYFGPNTNGKWGQYIDLLCDYINNEDQKIVIDAFSINKLQELADKREFDPITIRYRLNSEKETIWLESTAFFTTNKGETHVTILTKNVTENAEYIRSQNVLLQNALKESKQANNAKNEFLAILSHEIRTPMNAVIGLSSSILLEDLPKSIKEDVENINTASNNLLDVIDGILDISKIESGVLSLEEKQYNVPKFFKEIERFTKEEIGNKNIKFKLIIDPKTPVKLYGDSSKIRQVLQNLLNNSIKFTQKGSITIDVKTKKDKNNIKLIMSVIDTGVGIHKEKLERLFDETKKTTDNDSKYIEGMGLTITKKIIDLMKGEISVESEVGQGTVFTVAVNQKIVSEKVIGNIDEYVLKNKKSNVFNASGKKILVVDDNKLNLKVAEKLLKPYNIITKICNSGQEAIDIVKQDNNFDLILLDQMMPEMEGTEVLVELKKIKNFKTPIIVLTADAIVGKKEEYLEKGFDDYLSKPIDTNKLNDILKKYLK